MLPGGLLQLTMPDARMISGNIKYLFILFRVLVQVSNISKMSGRIKRSLENVRETDNKGVYHRELSCSFLTPGCLMNFLLLGTGGLWVSARFHHQ